MYDYSIIIIIFGIMNSNENHNNYQEITFYMEIKEAQKKISKIFSNNSKRDSVKVDDDYLMLKLTEELGEFVQSYVIHKKRCRPEKYLSSQKSKREMSKELSDVLGLILVIANNFDINLEEALVKKWITREWINKK